MSGELPPLYAVSGDDHGAYCIISTATWACITGLTAVVRFALAWHHRLKVGWDDISFAVAAAFAVASLALYAAAADAGLGQHIDHLDAQSVSRYFKTIYAADLTGIVAIGCSKLSAALLSKRAVLIEPRYFYSFIVAVAVWMLFSLFGTAFQCQLPQPWIFLPSNCPSRGNLRYAVTIFNMTTDVILSVWVIRPVWKVNMSRQDRIVVIILFGTRIIIPGVAVGQLICLASVMDSPDQTWNNFSLVLINQAILSLSVILATVPRVNRFLYSLRDNLVFPRISDFELGRYLPHTDSPGEPKITPSPPTTTDATTTTYNTQREARLKPWKRHVVMGGQEEKNTSTSTLHDRDAVGGCETSVETDDPGTDCQTMTNGS